ncbi:uncharacterized protein ccdc162p.L [Xenopus laevis]|uniref:Uncharacterized protein ccdc162p.L n=2 Tax=Xenopus laevis TaxID=8355 RepID=A0A1L8G907_XENLA|nr:uncharacterized protein ccdc162p.L [Xenopus laevis]OCT80388.1 hypothetical protein XELAEV_18027198mg [Xenopus laevis]
MSEVYRIASTEKIQLLEKTLASDLAELKTEIEENGALQGASNRMYSSVPKPKDALYFRNEREMILKKGLQVASGKSIAIQSDIMQKELESCLRREYTVDNLPLLLHQFYTDRIEHLVRSKYLHLMRWKRFCQHTSAMEQCYPIYQKQVGFIMQEYNDALQRAQRLSVARDNLITGQKNSLHLLTLEDLVIYLQWLICHLHSVKNIHNYIQMLQYLPVTDKAESFIENQSEELQDHSQYGIRWGSVSSGLQEASEQAGVRTDEDMSLPQHQTERNELKSLLRHLLPCFNIEYDTDGLTSTVSEMELLSLVASKFRTMFSKQQTMRTFPVYDSGTETTEGWGFKGPSMALKKTASWIPYIRVKPKRDPWQQKCLTKLKQNKKVDELLRLQSQVIEISSAEKTMEILQSHAENILMPTPVQPASARSSLDIWIKIYSPPDFPQDVTPCDGLLPAQIDEKNCEFAFNKRPVSSRQKKDTEYNYQTTLQLFGLEEAEDNNTDPVMIKGAYLSLLYLRHLRIRELQRVSLGFLNYFRSIQRTMTFDTCGLTGKSNSLSFSTGEEPCWINAAQGGSGVPGGLGSHLYMHNIPADFKVQSCHFMEFAEVENQDDFYTTEDGIIHIQDQRGAFIMYDVALEDLQELEEQLLLMATCLIEQEKGIKSKRMEGNELDISSWAHITVDRFAILLDLWTWESALLENKKQLIDSYFEAYQHTLDKEERFALVQVITNIMFRRPRFDIGSKYFLKAYSDECQCLRLHLQLLRKILNSQIDSEREFIQKVWRNGQKGSVSEFGLPLNIITKQLVSLNNSSPALKNVYLLEFHPSLGMAHLISKAVDHVCQAFLYISQAKTASEASNVEKHVLQLALDEWLALRDPKSSFDANIQKDLFAEVLIEDPLLVKDICLSALDSADEDKKHGRSKQMLILETFAKVLELVTIRHRLIETSAETVLLSGAYTAFAEEMGFSESHLYLRPVHFEFASHKDKVEQLPPTFITAILEDDSCVDKYAPSTNLLAIHDVDDNQLGKFSFWTKEGILQLLNKSGIENMQVVLACQLSQRNALLAAIQLGSVCHEAPVSLTNTDFKDSRSMVQRRKSSEVEKKSTSWALAERQMSLTSLPQTNGHPLQTSRNKKRLPDAFVSIQLEKVGPRDAMLNMFLQKKQLMGTAMKNPEEVEKVKRELVTNYCQRLNSRTCNHALRGQIIAYCNSLKNLLEEVPAIRKKYFIIGQPQNRKSGFKEAPHTDSRIFQERPYSLLTEDGRTFLNLWYIPSPAEVLAMFKTLPEKATFRALYQTLQIVAALHDIVSYVFSFAQLGNSCSNYRHSKHKTLAADWGGTEGIGAELLEIQKSIDDLSNPQDPKEVTALLLLRREVMFLQFDAAVRYLIREAFLSTGNVRAFNVTTDNMYHGLPALSNSVRASAFSSLLPLPEPLDPHSYRAFMLYPWRTLLANSDFFPLSINNLHTLGYHMQLCLCEMTDHERSVAHGELVGVKLLMEDILQSDNTLISFAIEGNQEAKQTSPDVCGAIEESKDPVQSTCNPMQLVPHDPIGLFQLLRSFLILWKQLEVFKERWGRLKLQVEKINTVPLYKQLCELYRDDIFYPTMKAIARQMGKEEEFEGIILRSQIVLPPKGASEVEIRICQLHKILEDIEAHMILKVKKKTAKELTLVKTERSREASLPTELWKQNVMNEHYSPVRPQIVEKFVQNLMRKLEDRTSEVIVRKDHLEDCLKSLACDVMERERSNFETYSMFYENILHQEHQLLYQKEQEMAAIDANQSQMGETFSKTAEMSHELLLEVTALRAKLSDLEEESHASRETIRKEIQEEHEALVRSLFAQCVYLKSQLEEYHMKMKKHICELISEVRKEGVDDIILLKNKYGSTKDNNSLTNNLSKQNMLQSLREENSSLKALICKMKALNHWKTTTKEGQLRKSISNAEKEAVQNKKVGLKLKLNVDQELTLLRQQLMVARTSLTRTQAENSHLNQLLSKQKEQLSGLEHRYSQEMRNRQQAEREKSASVDKLMGDIEDRESRLRTLTEEAERSSRMGQMHQNKIKREVKQMRSQMIQERSLKLDAFQRVDELQTHVYDLEMLSVRNSPTGIRKTSASLASPSGRSFSAVSSPWSSQSTALGQGPIGDFLQYYVPPDTKASSRLEMRLQRPKTVPSRCRNRAAGTVVPNMADSTSQAILTQLLDLRLNFK